MTLNLKIQPYNLLNCKSGHVQLTFLTLPYSDLKDCSPQILSVINSSLLPGPTSVGNQPCWSFPQIFKLKALKLFTKTTRYSSVLGFLTPKSQSFAFLTGNYFIIAIAAENISSAGSSRQDVHLYIAFSSFPLFQIDFEPNCWWTEEDSSPNINTTSCKKTFPDMGHVLSLDLNFWEFLNFGNKSFQPRVILQTSSWCSSRTKGELLLLRAKLLQFQLSVFFFFNVNLFLPLHLCIQWMESLGKQKGGER